MPYYPGGRRGLANRTSHTDAFAEETRRLRQLERDSSRGLRLGRDKPLPGNACFLKDGRVLCRERERGDSRYPYGRNGFNFWVYASGYMHGNDGLFFLFLPSGEGQEPSIAFFAGLRIADGHYHPISLLPVPYLDEAEGIIRKRYTVFGADAAYFVTEIDALWSTVRVFVTQAGAASVEIAFSIYLQNRSGEVQELYTSAYMNPFCRHQLAATFEDRWFKKVSVVTSGSEGEVLEDGSPLPPFVVSVNEDVSRFRSNTNLMVVRRTVSTPSALADLEMKCQVCTSRGAYRGGPRRGLAQAAFLRTGRFENPAPLTVFHDNAVIGDLNRLRLPPESSVRLDYLLSLPDTPDVFHKVLSAPLRARTVDAAHVGWCRALDNIPHDLDMRFEGCGLEGISDDMLNRFLPLLLKQVQTCADAKGYAHPSANSLIGIRDVFQAIEGHLFDQPEAAKAKMREALNYVLVDGRCPRQYSLPVHGKPGRADLREFIDQGAWVISTVYTYVATTGDSAFLGDTVGYHRVKPHNENALERAEEEDSVLEHLIRITDYLSRQRDRETGLLRALYGDWNDALDGLGTTGNEANEFGSGVSVMASLQLYRNCAEMIEILTRFGPVGYRGRIEEYQRTIAQLRDGLLGYAVVQRAGERRIVHGWGDGRQYHVGSFRDSDGLARDGLTSNAFWVICGMLAEDPTLRGDILNALNRLDSPFGLKSFEPGFAPDAPGVGRIPKLPIGTAENGATYIHATTFGIMALFLMDQPTRAWQQIYKILPFAPHQHGLSHSPFVMPNSYVCNPELNLTGQNMNDWQTGSANVLLKALIWFVIGFRPGFDTLCVAPAAGSPMRGFEFRGRAHGRRVRITYSKEDVAERRFLLNGVAVPATPDDLTKVPGVSIPYARLSLDSENVITVVDAL